MQHSVRVLLNIIASFTRVVINAIATLIATRIALRVLGASDFGLYNLLAGTVAILSFINGALTISAQRYFSIALGANDKEQLNRYYNATLSIHFLLGFLIVLLLLSIKGLLFNYVLNIDDTQVSIGMAIYNIMVISSAITVMTIPYSAIMNAHEDLVMMAIADIVSCVVKLVAALVLLIIDRDLLLVYSLVMLGSAISKALIEFIWSKAKYNEIKEHFSLLINTKTIREMLGFVGWNTLGSFAVVIRNQGIAVVLNIFWGTIINTAYGIANQVNSLVLSFATSLTSVFSPIIIQAKGGGDEERMRFISMFSSKLSFFLSSMLALPILVFIDCILQIWLGDYPPETTSFCFFVVLSFLVLQLYPGINRAIYASGQIKGYQIALSVLLVSILPIGALLFKVGLPSYSIIIVMLVSQVGTLVATIWYAVRLCHFRIWELTKSIAIKPIICFLFFLAFFSLFRLSRVYTFIENVESGIAILLVVIFSILFEIIYAPIYYLIIFNQKEKVLANQMLKSLIRFHRQ